MHEFAGFQRIAQGILHAAGTVDPAGAGRKHDRRRVVGDAVEEAVGRQVDVAGLVDGGDPADGPGHDQAVEGILGQAVAVLGLVKHGCFLKGWVGWASEAGFAIYGIPQ